MSPTPEYPVSPVAEDPSDLWATIIGLLLLAAGLVSVAVDGLTEMPWYAAFGLIFGGAYLCLPRRMRRLGDFAVSVIKKIRGN